MIDISNKKEILRIATATGKIYLSKNTISKIKAKLIKKGDPIETAKVAAMYSIKNTSNLIPHCHQILINDISFEYNIFDDYIEVFITVKAIARTGVEMEALIGVSIMLNVIWDMVKYLEKDEKGQYPNTKITEIKIIEKKKIEEF